MEQLHKFNIDKLICTVLVFNRRTGKMLSINPRKDSKGFDNVDDYFPDSGWNNSSFNLKN